MASVFSLLDDVSETEALPLVTPETTERSINELIQDYFGKGFSYREITAVLFRRHAVKLSAGQLRARLRKLDLKRRGLTTPLQDVAEAIKAERATSGCNLGCRALWHRLRMKHRLSVSRDTVMMMSAVLDPDGAQARQKKKLKRRIYRNKGSSFIWHVDGYDKLKPYGFAIHGCIDGYSRRIMWLECSSTNNDPYVIAGYFLRCVKEVGGAPTILRADRGNENCHLSFLQPFLRHGGIDGMAGEKSFLYGRSTSNQRIEAWWGQLRKNSCQWWMTFFKDLRDSGRFDDSNLCQRDALKLSFMTLIQTELNQVKCEWNIHRVRPSPFAEAPGGKPDVLFFAPEVSGGCNCKKDVSLDDVAAAEEFTRAKPLPYPVEFEDLASVIAEEEGLPTQPCSAEEALELYLGLVSAIERL